MITFKDLQIETKEYDFFVPFGLKAIIGLQLKENNIPFTTTSWREVDRTKHAAEIKDAETFFEKHQCPWDPKMMEIIHCPIKPESLREKSLLFFGPTMDPDYKKEVEESRIEAEEYFHQNIEPDLKSRNRG